MTGLAQLSRRDDMIFRSLMIPVGLYLIVVGIRAIRNRRLHLRKREKPVQGTLAVTLGVIITLAGTGFIVSSIMSFVG
ncbi:hypothetical protein SH661x_001635 [Planctomicrobium sp. SH661]|uniref:hypothetical protein n=1 Tax=Planctomicrobium sp. SH661 TaxID=3448124 RepID=UPI003F5B0E3F